MRQIKIRLCPRCRGHELERTWCDNCKGSGFIKESHFNALAVINRRNDFLKGFKNETV